MNLNKLPETIIPKCLADLGLKILFDGDYHAIDTDGVLLRIFETKLEAVNYLREMYAEEIKSNQ